MATMSPTSAASARTRIATRRRLEIVVGFAVAVLLLRVLGAPVPDGVLETFAAYITLVAILQKLVAREMSVFWLDRVQMTELLIDVTLVTAIYTAVGGMWWMGSAIHSVLATAAYVSLPRARARIVAVYAVTAFIGGIIAQAAGAGSSASFLGSASLEGNYLLAFVAALLGTVAIISGSYIQVTFVTISGRAEKRSRLIVKTAPHWIVTTDITSKITSANEATRALTGRRDSDLIGLKFVELFDVEDRAHATAEFEASLADGISRNFEARYHPPDDEVRYLRCSCDRFNDESSEDEMLIIGRDITERVRDHQTLREREALLADTENLAHIGSWEWDIKSDVMRWSDGLYRIFGVETGTPLDFGHFLRIVHPDDVRMVRSTIQLSVQTGEPFEVDFRLGSKGGSRFVHGIGHVLLDDNGCATRLAGSAQDVTELNTLTEQLRRAQKMEAVGRLAGGIAHDFNNILTVIRTYSEFLLESLTDRISERADVDEIRKAADKATLLVKQLLVFSRRPGIEPQAIDLNRIVEDLQSMMHRVVGADIEIRTRLGTNLWCVHGDPGQIEQVLMNLVVNACDAMPSGGWLQIETANVVVARQAARFENRRAGEFVSLKVSDSGHGMDAETQARIFEPFFTRKDQGTGLGLSIVYGIVAQWGGYIEVQSEPQRGTTFKLYMPKEMAGVRVVEPKVISAERVGGSETILLVEDQDAVRAGVNRTLARAGYTVIGASNGVEALAIVESKVQKIDIILTDMSMPEMGGKELATRVASGGNQIPILFMSGYTEDAVDDAENALTDTIFRKPFTNDALLMRIRGLLDLSTASGKPPFSREATKA